MTEDGARIQEIIDHIDEYLYKKKHSSVDGIHAMTVMTLAVCRTVGISKPHLLSYISNMWEVNDPEAENYPSKEHSTRVWY